jgi:hypothetical protein
MWRQSSEKNLPATEEHLWLLCGGGLIHNPHTNPTTPHKQKNLITKPQKIL